VTGYHNILLKLKIKPNHFIFIIFALILGSMACIKIYTLHTTYYDLGVFDWNFWRISVLSDWNRAFYGHAQPFMLVFSLPYGYWPSSFFLVITQAVMLAAPILLIPKIVYFAGKSNSNQKDLVNNSFTSIFVYALFFPVWYNALFDYHMDHLAVLLGFVFFLACFNNRWLLAALAGIGIAFVKEPFALSTVACGVYIICRQLIHAKKVGVDSEKIFPYTAGIFLIVFGSIYFYIVVDTTIPYFTNGQRPIFDSAAYSWLGGAFSENLYNLFVNSIKILEDVFTTPMKVFYIIAILSALAFVPLLSPLELIPAFPLLAISLLSQHNSYYGIGNHYTAGLIAPLMVAFILGLPRYYMLSKKIITTPRYNSSFLFALIIFFHIMLSPSPLSRLFWTDKVWQYGVSAYVHTSRDTMIKDAIMKYIPIDQHVVVSVQNTVNLSHLVHRDNALVFPDGVTGNNVINEIKKKADYVVIDMERPWFLLDKGCQWVYGECKNYKSALDYKNSVEHTMKIMDTIFEKDNFFILKRS